MVARGCGLSRVSGGIYFTVPLGPEDRSHPVECFLVDTAYPVSDAVAQALRITSVGVHAIRQPDGSTYVYDVIGREHYPNVSDFLEEARRFGISRRVQATFPFDQLDARSRLVLLHARGVVNNSRAYFEREFDAPDAHPCPNLIARAHCGRRASLGHIDHEPCARAWWQDVEGGTPVGPSRRLVRRAIGDTRYLAYRRPDDVQPSYGLGIVGVFPLGPIEIVRDPLGETYAPLLERTEMAGIPTVVVAE